MLKTLISCIVVFRTSVSAQVASRVVAQDDWLQQMSGKFSSPTELEHSFRDLTGAGVAGSDAQDVLTQSLISKWAEDIARKYFQK